MKKILITGAAGFIGSHLVEGLVKKGCDVRVFVSYYTGPNPGCLRFIPKESRKKIDVMVGDIKNFDDTIDEFKKFPLDKQQHILFDLLNKNQLYVNLSEIEDKEFNVGSGDKKMNGEFYE